MLFECFLGVSVQGEFFECLWGVFGRGRYAIHTHICSPNVVWMNGTLVRKTSILESLWEGFWSHFGTFGRRLEEKGGQKSDIKIGCEKKRFKMSLRLLTELILAPDLHGRTTS